MKFGVTWVPSASPSYWSAIEASEAAGFELLGVPDSQAGEYRESWSVLTSVLARTRTAAVGPLATNPVTRHPAVTAAALATAAEQSGGRAFLCLATGDTGVLNLGLAPAKLAELEEYLLAVRSLVGQGVAEYRGNTMSLRWSRQEVPILIAADGPRALRLAGRVADGVVVGTGMTPEVVSNVRQLLAEGAAEVGRDPAQLQVWWMARCAIERTREEALARVLPSLAAAAAHAFRPPLTHKSVPAELVAPLAELMRRYQVGTHNVAAERNPNAALVAELGLGDFLADRMGIVGTEAQARDRIAELGTRGVDNLIIRPLTASPAEFLDAWQRVRALSAQPGAVAPRSTTAYA